MKNIKSYIIASILGLLNVIPGNTHAKFVENENFPYFYDQADRVVNGIHWFRSKTNPNEVFYILVRESISFSSGKTGWHFVYKDYPTQIYCYNKEIESKEKEYSEEDIEDLRDYIEGDKEYIEKIRNNLHWPEDKKNERIKKAEERIEKRKKKIKAFHYRNDPLNLSCLREYHFKSLIVDHDHKEIHPNDYDIGDKKLYRYLYDNYMKAENSVSDSGIITDFSRLLGDNPLDNMGYFYSGKPAKTEPLVQRVLNDKFREDDKGKISLEMYAIDIGNTEKTGFKTPEGFSKNLKWNDQQENLFKYFVENMYLQHGQPKKNLNNTVESDFNSKILDPDNSDYNAKYNENYKESSLQNQKHVFFSPVMPGFENDNSYSNSFRYHFYTIIENKDFFNLPLIGMSDEMTGTIQMPSYTGKPIDVLKMLFYNELFKDFERCKNLKVINALFTLKEVRIPTYTDVDKWYEPHEYYKTKSDDQICLEQKLTE